MVERYSFTQYDFVNVKKQQQTRCLKGFMVQIRYVFTNAVVRDRSSTCFICRSHMAHFVWFRSWTRNGLCQLSEWPEVALFTAQEPKGLSLKPIVYQNFTSRLWNPQLDLTSVFFNRNNGYKSSKGWDKKKKKKKFLFFVLFMRDSRVALLYSYNLVSYLNCSS